MAKTKFLGFLAAFVASIALGAAVTYNLTIMPSTLFADGTAIPTGAVTTYSLYQNDCTATPVKQSSGLTTLPFQRIMPDGSPLTCIYASQTTNGIESDLGLPYRIEARPAQQKKPMPPTIKFVTPAV